jgi:signal transduction histidine kinase
MGTPRLLLLDEPTDALEAHKPLVLQIIERLRQQGVAVLLVTQNLEDIFRISDRIVVLSAGIKIAERHTTETTEEEIVRLILGSVENNLTPAVWALSNYFEVRRQAEELDRLNKAFGRRAARLQAHVEVAHSTTSILDRDNLLPQITQIIQQRFDYYYTGIFLLTADGDYLELQSCASRDGQHLSLGQLRLRVDSAEIIGRCALGGQPQLVKDTLAGSPRMTASTLPDTRSELVLPLRIGQRVLGVLDLQSDERNAFDEEDTMALQGLGHQLAIAIRNADLFEAAQKARRQADEANRYKSVFLSNMSHELRTPLSVIIGHTQAMLKPTANYYTAPLPDEYARDLETIRKNGEHLLALINDILDLSKIEAGQLRLNPTVIDLAAICDDALRVAEGLLHGKAIDLISQHPPHLQLAWGDSLRTQQIMINLLSNAVKFTESGSITVATRAEDGKIVVAVTDTGIGIPEHLQDVIFDRFRQGKTASSTPSGGTGLGLSISQQLVELQGGRIWIESEHGAGSTVSFTIPQASPEQLAAHRPQDESPLYEARRMVIFEPPSAAGPGDAPQMILLAQNESAAATARYNALHDAGYVVEQTPLNDQLIEIAELMLPDLMIVEGCHPPGDRLIHDLVTAPQLSEIAIIMLAHAPIAPSGDRAAPVRCLLPDDHAPDKLIALVHECFLASRAP